MASSYSAASNQAQPKALLPSIRISEDGYTSPLAQLRQQANSARRAANPDPSSSYSRTATFSAPLQFNNFRNSSASISTLASSFSSLTTFSTDTYTPQQHFDEFGRSGDSPTDAERSRRSEWECYDNTQVNASGGSRSGRGGDEDEYPGHYAAAHNERSAATPIWEPDDPESIITFTPSSAHELSRSPSQDTIQSAARSEIHQILLELDRAPPLLRSTPHVTAPVQRVVSSSGWESLKGDAGEDWEAAAHLEASRARQAGLAGPTRPSKNLAPIKTSTGTSALPPPRPSPGGRIYSGRAAPPPPKAVSPAPHSAQSGSPDKSFTVFRPNFSQPQSTPAGQVPTKSSSSATPQSKHVSAYSVYDVQTPTNASFNRKDSPSGLTSGDRDSVLAGTYSRVPLPASPSSNSTPISGLPSTPLSTLFRPPSSASPTAPRLQQAEMYLNRGIELHAKSQHDDRRGDLAESTFLFRRAAEGGSPAGAVFFGLALRNGWGIQKDEKKGFHWLQRACQGLLSDTNGLDAKLGQSGGAKIPEEIIMAIQEIGRAYLEGIGVKADPTLGLGFLRFAAKLDDLDAQELLGVVLSLGRFGIKKDLHEAAYWYRRAVNRKGGLSPIGLSWINKDKYMHDIPHNE